MDVGELGWKYGASRGICRERLIRTCNSSFRLTFGANRVTYFTKELDYGMRSQDARLQLHKTTSFMYLDFKVTCLKCFFHLDHLFVLKVSNKCCSSIRVKVHHIVSAEVKCR